jgi:hypothetical protein
MDLTTCAIESAWTSGLGDALSGVAALIASLAGVAALVRGSSERKAWRTQRRADKRAEAAVQFSSQVSRLLDKVAQGGDLLDLRVDGTPDAWQPPFLQAMETMKNELRALLKDVEANFKEHAIYLPAKALPVAQAITEQAERVIALDTPMLTWVLQDEHPDHRVRLKWVSPAVVAADLRGLLHNVLGPYARWER